MKAARVHAFTKNPADIRVEDIPAPEPGPGQVRVRMRLCPVNPSDLNFVHGTYYQALERVSWNQGDGPVCFDAARTSPCPVPPYSLGVEGMGVVESSGGGLLARRLVGKRVAVVGGPPAGVWQELAVVDARRAVAVPDSLPDAQAAMYFVNPVSAFVMVRHVLNVPRGGWLLVTAAGSALGRSVLRMGKLFGYRTLCVVRSDIHTADLKALGADAVIDTSQQDLVREAARITSGKGVGYAIDCVGGQLAAEVVRCLGLGGHLLLYGTLDGSPVPLNVRDLMMPVARVEGFYLGNWFARQSPLTLLGVLRTVKRLTLQGVFHTQVGEIFDLDRVGEAVAASGQTGRSGKVLLKIG